MSPVLRKRLTATRLVDVPCDASSLQEAAGSEPGGVYTVCNTQRGQRVLGLDAHLERLEDSAARQGFSAQLSRRRLRLALRHMLDEAGYAEMRFRLTVPRAAPDETLITIEPWQPPPESLRQAGVRCAIAGGLSRRDPTAKDSAWLQQRDSFTLPPGCYEALLTAPDGSLLEGLGSNFYAVLANELRTAAHGVLAGITRGIVLQLAPALLPLRLSPVRLDDLPRLEEAFLSSSSRGLLPIVQIDDRVIAEGEPGPFSRAIRRAFERHVESQLEEL